MKSLPILDEVIMLGIDIMKKKGNMMKTKCSWELCQLKAADIVMYEIITNFR